MQHVLAVARALGTHLDEYRIVVDKSTVPVGTADRVTAEIQRVLNERGVDREFDVVANPEFLKEGAAIEDFMKPDRIIVGTDNPRTAELLRVLYEPFNRSRDRMLIMDVRSAELTKYAANAMLATKISFINELANIAERVGADIEQVRLGIGSDPRIGYEFIYPGAGYGGSCFPKDVKALRASAARLGYEAELLGAVENVNERQKVVLFDKIVAHFGGDLAGKTIALWGLAFKPNTDDMREASSRVLLERFWERKCSVRAYDPVARDEARRIYGERADLVLCTSADEALEGADALAIVTEWREFRSPDFELIRARLREPVIFDGRNLYEPAHVQEAGLIYYAIGRGESLSAGAARDEARRTA
jgi:UDPglucose 6-dehydrogenase